MQFNRLCDVARCSWVTLQIDESLGITGTSLYYNIENNSVKEKMLTIVFEIQNKG